MSKPDPKPRKRTQDPGAGQRKLLYDPVCRGCGARATEAHHILHRSQGGDDDRDNIMPLCATCHRLYHSMGDLIHWRLEPLELAYLTERLGLAAGQDYARRRYGANTPKPAPHFDPRTDYPERYKGGPI